VHDAIIAFAIIQLNLEYLTRIGDNQSPMKRSDLPSLDNLRAFEATARLRSVRSAAKYLALTHGAVSRRVSKLSEHLGIRLFEKSGRGLRLTQAGETLFLTVSRLFGELENTVRNLRPPQAEDKVVALSCEPSVAMRWLIPRLGKYENEQPDIALHLSVGGGPIDFTRDGINLAIRRLDFPMLDAWHIEHLFAERVGPVMAPRLVSSFEAGNYIALGSKTRADAWSKWLAAHPDCPRPRDIRLHDHHFLMAEAASASLGVALSPKVLAIDDIERGRLVAPEGFVDDGTYYGLILPKRTKPPASVAQLMTWLRRQCALFLIDGNSPRADPVAEGVPQR
jgi:DNA-binding transcriptional LysR family regulator